ncbi:MAG TPA: phytoene desaturase family protein [Candidatus Limnocylindrales bacterium]|jgi:phytoene desaturase|nr:phytoene desaturase family protein [Candidatus Limnocylindrales bacterium]
MTSRSVVVVGAGVAGITAAAHLARAGLHVTVVEKDAAPGGRCGRFVREGHRFDTGPTLFVMPLLYASEFRALGASLAERLELRPVDPTYRLVFDDGSQLSLTSDMTTMRGQLDAIEPGSFDGLERYMEAGARHYRVVAEKMVDRDFRWPIDYLRIGALGLLARGNPLANHYRGMSAYFDAPRLKSAFTFQDLYVGLSPFEAPAILSLLSYTELAHGVWYPAGGMYSIVETLVDLARDAGVEFAFGANVERIDTDTNTARGVVLADGARLTADVVLANADLPYVYEHLLPPDGMARSLSRKRYSSSAISFFWGLDRPYLALPAHTLFLADDYLANFESIVRDHGLPANPSVYIHAPAQLDAAAAPTGQDTLTAIVPVGHLRDDGTHDWNELRDVAREHVFRRLRTVGLDDVRDNIKFEESYTPPTWAARHNLAKGATHGLSHTLTQMGYLRPRNRHRRYRNLYFAGASTHPGTGVPTAMSSGRLAARRIVAELR